MRLLVRRAQCLAPDMVLRAASRRGRLFGWFLRPTGVKRRNGNDDPGLGPAERVIADSAQRQAYGIREHGGVEIEKRRSCRQSRRRLYDACDCPTPEAAPDRKSDQSKLGAEPPEYIEARWKLAQLLEPIENLVAVPGPGRQQRLGVKAELAEPDAKERVLQEDRDLRAEQRQPRGRRYVVGVYRRAAAQHHQRNGRRSHEQDEEQYQRNRPLAQKPKAEPENELSTEESGEHQ